MADLEEHGEEKWALLVAAAGRHNVLLAGAPGASAVALARRLPGLLSPMDERERFEAAAVHSVAGLLDPERDFGWERRLRLPHHTASPVAIAGSTKREGRRSRPGEVSLAHAGVLLLDEVDEFERGAIETVREALAHQLLHHQPGLLPAGGGRPAPATAGSGRRRHRGDVRGADLRRGRDLAADAQRGLRRRPLCLRRRSRCAAWIRLAGVDLHPHGHGRRRHSR